MTISLVRISELNKDQSKQYSDLIKESASEPMFYGDRLNCTRDRMVILVDNQVVGAFEFSRIMYQTRVYNRTNRPYLFKDQRGHGYMQEALRLWYANRRPALAWIDDENVKSINLFMSLGFDLGDKSIKHGKEGHFYVLE